MQPTFVVLLLIASLTKAFSATSINASNKYAYGANIGWLDPRGDTNHGAIVGEFVCAGNLFSADVGWISLGNGAPTNGIQYKNLSTNDFGVNQDGFGNLRGFAYGANIGWISFESNGAPSVNPKTGKLTGSIYSANCGWISLSNTLAFVQTDTIPGGLDSDANGLPDAWELFHFGAIGVNPNADPDHDGPSNKQEYLAGTNPTNSSDNLRISAFSGLAGGINVNITWSSVPSRFYLIEKAFDIGSPLWTDSGLGLIDPTGSSTSRPLTDTNAPKRFYRVQAVRPLAP